MNPFLRHFWHMSVFKEGPDQTPYSKSLLISAALLFMMIMVLQWGLLEPQTEQHLGIRINAGLSLVVVYFIYTYIILRLSHMTARWVQTLTALYLMHAWIHFLAMPLFLVDSLLTDVQLEKPIFFLVAMVYLLVTLMLSLWQFVITAYLYKCALNSNTIQATLLTLGLMAVSILTVSLWR